MEGTINAVEDSEMAQAEKSATHSPGSSQNGEKNVVNLGPRDSLHGRLEVQGDLKIAGNVEGELKASGDVTVDSGASIQASIEGSNVSVRGQVTGNVTAKKRLTLGGSGVDRLSRSSVLRRGGSDDIPYHQDQQGHDDGFRDHHPGQRLSEQVAHEANLGPGRPPCEPRLLRNLF